ncbi:caspase family protein [Phormidium tenue FACHB-886]|nr:caspase family protein [Phormidium tenue FACHB-886]
MSCSDESPDIVSRRLVAELDDQSPNAPQPIIHRWALLVGINRYVDPAFAGLRFCVNDVQVLEQLLTQLGYTVVCLHDQLERDDPRFPTQDNVIAELTRLCKSVGAHDLLFIHFACHGTLIDRQPVLICYDTRYTTLNTTALPLAQIETQMRQSKAKRLILTLDACHTGVEIGRDVSDPEFIRNAYDFAEGFALIAASTAEQVAQEWQEMEHGVFTYYLLEGLSGKASAQGHEFVTIHDLQTYVLSSLRCWNVQQGGRIQEPTARTEGLGDMILADYRQHSLTLPLPPRQPNRTRSATPPSAQALLTDYVQALELFSRNASPAEEQALALLQTRDRIPVAALSATELVKLEQCDRQLKSQKSLILQTIDLAHWRDTTHPPETAWWWFLEPDSPHAWVAQSGWIWTGLSTIALTASGALVLNLWSYFFAAGVAAASTSGIVLNSFLTLVTGGSALTQVKQDGRDRLFTALKLPKWIWQPASSGAAVILMLMLVGVRTSLPLLAVRFQQAGEQKLLAADPDLDGALADYQQAIALNPGDAEAHYQLGVLYETLQKNEQAIASYQLALQSGSSTKNKSTLLRAGNNLGRLYLLKGDTNKAFPPLERTIGLIKANDLKTNPDIKTDYYSVLKNMGWLRVLQKRYVEAAPLLQQAIAFNPDRAAAHCLQAQVFEAQRQNQDALQAWEKCSQFAVRSFPEEDQWIGLANSASDRLTPKGAQP